MAEPMTEEELQDLRARVERVPLCYQREADKTIARLLATVNELTVENSELYASLDATMNEDDRLKKELKLVTGLLRDLNPRSRFAMNPTYSAIDAAAQYLNDVERRAQTAPPLRPLADETPERK